MALRNFGSIIKVGVEKEPTNKKVEHILPKSVKMELLRNLKRRTKYALQIFYRKTLRIARHFN